MTKKMSFKKIAASIISSLFMLALLSVGTFNILQSFKDSYAATTTDTSILSVEKINGWVEPESTVIPIAGTNYTLLQTISASNYVMLSPEYTSTTSDEYILVKFTNTYGILTINAYVNGTRIATSKTYETVDQQNRFFYLLISLDPSDQSICKYQAGVSQNLGAPLTVSEREGLYSFSFSYSYITAFGDVVTSTTPKTVSFNLVNDAVYNTSGNDLNSEFETVANAEVVGGDLVDDKPTTVPTEYYFNYNNANTLPASLDAEKLYYPTVTYDFTKYSFGYDKTLYNTTTNSTISVINQTLVSGKYTEYSLVLTKLDAQGEPSDIYDEFNETTESNTYTLATLTCTNGIYSFKNSPADTAQTVILDGVRYTINLKDQDLNATSTIEMEIINIGQYVFSRDYLFKSLTTNGFDYITNLTLDDIKLTSFGYQLKYAANNTGSTNFSNAEIFSDLSYIFASKSAIQSLNETNITDTITSQTFTSVETTATDEHNYVTVTTQIYYTYEFDFVNYVINITATKSVSTYTVVNDIGSTDDLPATLTTVQMPIASTNQAPVWTNYSGTLSSGTLYNISGSGVTVSSYTKGMYITAPGMYALKVAYTYAGYSSDIQYQIFYFRITNAQPEFKILKYLGTESEYQSYQSINSGSFVNYEVYLAWLQPTPFDYDINITYRALDYTSNTMYPSADSYYYTNSSESSEVLIDGIVKTIIVSGKLTLTGTNGSDINGHYYIKMKYGNAQSSYASYEIVVDTNNIEDSIQLVDKNNEAQGLAPQIFTNQPFVLGWTEKASGAAITTTYEFVPFTQISSVNGLITGTKYMDIGYSTGTQTSALAYSNGIVLDEVNLASKMTAAGIYKFTLTDQAGNTKTELIMFEDSDPAIIQTPEQTALNSENIFGENMLLTWGTYKAIAVSGGTSIIADIPASYVEEISGTYYIKVPVTDISLFKFGIENVNGISALSESSHSTSGFIEYEAVYSGTEYSALDSAVFSEFGVSADSYVVFPDENATVKSYVQFHPYEDDVSSTYLLIKSNGNAALETAYKALFGEDSINEYGIALNAEGVFEVFVDDKVYSLHAQVNPATNARNVTNSQSLQFEINLDNSRVIVRAYDDDGAVRSADTPTEDTRNNSEDSRVYVNGGTNRLYTFTTWNTLGIIPFEIESLTLAYYPLALDTTYETNTNYPYAQDATMTYNLLSLIGSTALGTAISDTLNIIGSSTGEGKYVITRNYNLIDDTVEAGLTPEEITQYEALATDEIQASGDTVQKVYTFYIDRNEIIVSGTTIGSEIEMLLGANDVSFTSFSRYISGSETTLVLYTNLLPVQLIVPANKYSVADTLNSGSYLTNVSLSPFYLTVKIDYPSALIDQVITGTADSATSALTIDPITLNKITKLSSTNRYKFTITLNDYTGSSAIGDSNTVFAANTTTFDFYIESIAPSGNMYGESGREVIIGNSADTSTSKAGVNSVRDTSLNYTWTDPSDIYYAKIDTNKVTIYETTSNGSVATKSLVYGYDETDTLINTLGIDLSTVGTIAGGANKELVASIDTDSDGLDDYNQYTYSISLPADSDRLYEIYIAYEGDESSYLIGLNNSSYYENTEILAVDQTAPAYNFERIKLQDNFYQENSTNIEASNGVNYENYAFALDSDFVFTRATNTYVENNALFGYQQDTNRIFYRAYDKYEGGIYNEQSIVPTDADYNNTSVQGLRFSTTSSLYIEFTNQYSSNTAFANIVDEYGYYEIIECDEAGNYTVYTVLLRDDTFNLTLNKISDDSTIVLYSDDTLKNVFPYEITSINNGDVWYTVTITDITDLSNPIEYTFIHTYETNDTELLSSLNGVLTDTSGTKASLGARYIINITNRFGYEFEAITNIAGSAEITPVMSSIEYNDETYVKVLIPANTYITQLTSIEIIKVSGPSSEVTLTADNSDTPIEISNTGLNIAREYFFYAGKYIVEVTDNFGRTASIVYDVSYDTTISPNTPFTFSGNYIETTESGYNNTYYTAYGMDFEYQTITYGLSVYKNGLLIYRSGGINYLAANSITKTSADTLGLSILSFATPIANTSTEYILTLTDYVGNTKSYKVMFYTRLPTIILTDIYNNDMTDVLVVDSGNKAGSTSKQVVVSWSTVGIGTFNIAATYRFADAPSNLSGDSVSLAMGTILSDVGYYEITITNTDLASSTKVCFYINSADIATYAVFNNEGTTRIALTPAATQYVYNSIGIDQYFTKYGESGANYFSIEVNDDKGLTKTKIDTILVTTGSTSLSTSVTTTIWHISGSSNLTFDKIIAVSTVITPSGASFAANYNAATGTTAQMLTLSGVSTSIANVNTYTGTANTVTVSWPTYNGIAGNLIYLDVKLNDGSSLGYFYGGSVTLTESGKYSLYFYDLAGNQHTFAASTTSASTVFNLYKLNKVPFSIGVTYSGRTSTNSSPIDNAIYNGTVSILRLYADKVSGSMTVFASYNGGESLQVTSTNNQFIFEDAGYYVLTINAKIRATAGEATISATTYKFTIIDDDEARMGFEFSPINNYEITKVMQGTYDITDFLKGDNAALNSLFLSLYNGDTGLYNITVTVTYVALRAPQTFSFYVWIGGESPVVVSNVKFGSSTTKDITLDINKYLLYTANGNMYLKIIGSDTIVYEPLDASIVAEDARTLVAQINAETAGNVNSTSQIKLTSNGTYLIQFYSESGNLLASYRITKVAPLNTMAIVLIIIASLGLMALVFLFFKLRKRMRVR